MPTTPELMPPPLPWPRRLPVPAAALAFAAILTGCGGTAGLAGGAGAASDAEWRALREPRPEPLPGAPRLTVSDVTFLGSFPWPEGVRVGPGLGISELVVTNLLRRRDVDFVERRRFAAAAGAVRRGEPSPPGRPTPGVSRSADHALAVAWLQAAQDGASLEIRLIRLETGDADAATRVVVDRNAGPVAVARAIVAGTLDLLHGLRPLPEWSDPLAPVGAEGATPGTHRANVPPPARVEDEALRHFLRGLAAEEVWSWERARRGYQQAIAADPDFHEARVALARAARLRLGGTLAES